MVRATHLQKSEITLFRLLRDQFLFLTRGQIQRILTLETRWLNLRLQHLVSKGYLSRRYRLDKFEHFQSPLYYLGKRGCELAGMNVEEVSSYIDTVRSYAERSIPHLLAICDVLLKFLLESNVRRIIGSEDQVWRELINFGNKPDAWIQYDGGEAFVEIDLDTEHRGAVEKKLVQYANFKSSGGYRSSFPDCDFKVLFMTTTEERIGTLQSITWSDDVWYCTMEEFLKEPLGHQHWFALHGFYALPITRKKEVQGV